MDERKLFKIGVNFSAETRNIEKWIVIDDLDLHNEEIRKHQILTDASIGLTVENICEAERLLL